MQFCIQGKASAPAERHLSPVFSIETEAIRTKELFFEDSVKDLTIVSISRSIWAQLRNGPMDSTSRWRCVRSVRPRYLTPWTSVSLLFVHNARSLRLILASGSLATRSPRRDFDGEPAFDAFFETKALRRQGHVAQIRAHRRRFDDNVGFM